MVRKVSTPCGSKPGLMPLQRQKTAEHQARPHQQHETQRHFRHHHGVAQQRSAAQAAGPPAGPQHLRHIRTRRAQRRRKAEQHARPASPAPTLKASTAGSMRVASRRGRLAGAIASNCVDTHPGQTESQARNRSPPPTALRPASAARAATSLRPWPCAPRDRARAARRAPETDSPHWNTRSAAGRSPPPSAPESPAAPAIPDTAASAPGGIADPLRG